jgi:hypothetical protein
MSEFIKYSGDPQFTRPSLEEPSFIPRAVHYKTTIALLPYAAPNGFIVDNRPSIPQVTGDETQPLIDRKSQLETSLNFETARALEERIGLERKRLRLVGEEDHMVYKDPVAVFFKDDIHLYGTQGLNDVDELGIFHATAPSIDGPYTLQAPLDVKFNDGRARSGYCAPGVTVDGDYIYKMTQEDCFGPGGIELTKSSDGFNFEHVSTILEPDGNINYDSHPYRWQDELFATVNIGPQLRHSSVNALKSTTGTMEGQWKKHPTPVLEEQDIPYHNENDPEKEWNAEGNCGAELPPLGNNELKPGEEAIMDEDSILAMLGVVFLKKGAFGTTGEYGTRQRANLTFSEGPTEKQIAMSRPLLDPETEVDEVVSETGHPAFVTDQTGKLHIQDGRASFTYQAKIAETGKWRTFIGSFDVAKMRQLGKDVIELDKLRKMDRAPREALMAAD